MMPEIVSQSVSTLNFSACQFCFCLSGQAILLFFSISGMWFVACWFSSSRLAAINRVCWSLPWRCLGDPRLQETSLNYWSASLSRSRVCETPRPPPRCGFSVCRDFDDFSRWRGSLNGKTGYKNAGGCCYHHRKCQQQKARELLSVGRLWVRAHFLGQYFSDQSSGIPRQNMCSLCPVERCERAKP